MKKVNKDSKTRKRSGKDKEREIPRDVIDRIMSNVEISYTEVSVFECIHPDVKARLEAEKQSRLLLNPPPTE